MKAATGVDHSHLLPDLTSPTQATHAGHACLPAASGRTGEPLLYLLGPSAGPWTGQLHFTRVCVHRTHQQIIQCSLLLLDETQCWTAVGSAQHQLMLQLVLVLPVDSGIVEPLLSRSKQMYLMYQSRNYIVQQLLARSLEPPKGNIT